MSKIPRVTVVSWAYSDGNRNCMAETVRQLSRRGMLVRLVSNTYEVLDGELEPAQRNGYLPIRVIQYALRQLDRLFGIKPSRYFKEALFDHFASRNLGDPDIVYLDSERYPGVGRVARKRGLVTVGYQRMANINHMTKILQAEREKQGIETKFLNKRLNRRRQKGLAAMDYILAHSGLVKQTDIDSGYEEERIQVIHGCVDSNRYKPDPSQKAYTTVVLFSGHDPLLKGLLYLLEAWKDIPYKVLGAELWVAGDCDHSIRQRFSNVGGVRYLGTVGNMTEVYQQASIFVHPALVDAGPKVVTEALASGLPAIVTTGVGYSEIIRDGYNGFVVPAGDSQSLVVPITRLLAEPELREDMSKNARETISSLTMQVHADRVCEAMVRIHNAQ